MIKPFRLRFGTPLVERDLEEAKWNIIESYSGNFATDRRRELKSPPVLAVGAGSKSRVPKVVASTLGFGQKHDSTDDVPLDTMNDPRKKVNELSNWETDLSRREREIKRREDAIAGGYVSSRHGHLRSSRGMGNFGNHKASNSHEKTPKRTRTSCGHGSHGGRITSPQPQVLRMNSQGINEAPPCWPVSNPQLNRKLCH